MGAVCQEVVEDDNTDRLLAVFWPLITDLGYIVLRADQSIVAMTTGPAPDVRTSKSDHVHRAQEATALFVSPLPTSPRTPSSSPTGLAD
jgi:hypothetical protein